MGVLCQCRHESKLSASWWNQEPIKSSCQPVILIPFMAKLPYGQLDRWQNVVFMVKWPETSNCTKHGLSKNKKQKNIADMFNGEILSILSLRCQCNAVEENMTFSRYETRTIVCVCVCVYVYIKTYIPTPTRTSWNYMDACQYFTSWYLCMIGGKVTFKHMLFPNCLY